MKQKQFEDQHAALFEQIRAILDKRPHGRHDPRQLPALYRRLCQCLALARQRGYSPVLADYLQQLVAECHQRLYASSAERPATLMRWMLVEFPCRVRAEWRLLLFASLALYGVAIVCALLVWSDSYWAYSFMRPEQLENMRSMYQPEALRLGRGGSQGDMQMFGHYIWNNVSICFRSFGAGFFGGIPALFIIALNGMHLGVVGAWLHLDPVTRHQFWSFVITHASFEMTGLLLAGMAGMRIGLALIKPGRRTRGDALRDSAQTMYPVLVGAAVLTVLAAFVEAFWSASPVIPAAVKYAVGALCWAGVIGFFVFAGRGAQARRD